MTEPSLPKLSAVEMLSRFKQPGEVYNTHVHVALTGTSIDAFSEPAYWLPVCRQLRPLDRIEVLTDDNAYFAEYLVLAVNGDGAYLAPLRGIELKGRVGPSDTAARHATTVRAIHKGAHLKWCAMDATGEILKDKLATEAACLQWIATYAQGRAA